MKRVTQADIARALGLSQPTVGLVVGNGGKKPHEKLKQETIDRILQKAKEMGYRPDRHAQAMRGARPTLIGLLYEGGMMQVSNERAYNVARLLKERGCNLLTLDIYHGESVDEAMGHMLESQVDGVIVACTVRPSHLEPALERGLPIVGLASNDMPGLPAVRCDMRDGFLRLVEHLHSEGHRRLVQLISASDPCFSRRPWRWQQSLQMQGFRQGLERHGGTHAIGTMQDYARWKPEGLFNGFTLCIPEEYSRRESFQPFAQGMLLTRELLRAEHLPLPDVILSPNDDWAFGSINELLRAGLDVPRKITVTGFNDSRLSRDFFIPFTTVRQPTRTMTEKAVNILIRKIEKIRAKLPFKEDERLIHELPCELVVAASSCRRTASPSI